MAVSNSCRIINLALSFLVNITIFACLFENLLKEIQDNIYQKALAYREANTLIADDYTTFKKMLDETPGFILAHWDGTPETEEKIKEETKATIRCIPLDQKPEQGKCILTGNPSAGRVLFAKAY